MPRKKKEGTKKKSFWEKLNYKTYDASNGFGNSEQWKDSYNSRFANKSTLNEVKNENFKELYNCTSLKELKSAYRKLIVKFHPDKIGDNPESNKLTSELVEEYNREKKKFE